MAGASSAGSWGPFQIEKADPPQSDVEFEEQLKKIYKRAAARNEELAHFENSEKSFLKWLHDLQNTFQPTFYYRNLLGLSWDGDKKENIYKTEKDSMVDFAYLAFTRLRNPQKAADGSYIYNTSNGSISAHSGKIEFIAGKKGEGEKPGKKDFSLGDAYNLVLLAMQDRSMMPPNKMKFHGTAKERALLHHAATRINSLITDPNEQIILSNKKAPKFIFGMGNPRGLKAALKDDPFDHMVMDIRNNTTPANQWEAEEKEQQEAAQKSPDDENKQTQEQAAKPSGPDEPDPQGPPPSDPMPPSPEGGSGKDAADAAPAADKNDNNGNNGQEPPSITSEEAPPDIRNEPDVKERENAVKSPVPQKEETVSSDESARQEERRKEEAEKIYTRLCDYITEHEDILKGREPAGEIYSLLKLVYPGTESIPGNVQAVADRMERDGLVVRNAQTGAAAIRGLAQFTPHDPDYNNLALGIVQRPGGIRGATVDALTRIYENRILEDKLIATKGYGPKLPEIVRRDLAFGMAQRHMDALQQDNVVQMKDGKITYIAKGFDGSLDLRKNFTQASQPSEQAPKAQAPAAPQPVPVKPATPAQPQAEQSTAAAAKDNQDIYNRLDALMGKLNETAAAHEPESVQTVRAESASIPKAASPKPAPHTVPASFKPVEKVPVAVEFEILSDIEREQAMKQVLTQEETRKEPSALSPEVDKIVDDIFAGMVDGRPTQPVRKPTPEELGFKPVGPVEPLTLEDFQQASFVPYQPPPVDEAAEHARLVGDLEEIMRDSEQKRGVKIDESVKPEKPKIEPVWPQLHAAQ